MNFSSLDAGPTPPLVRFESVGLRYGLGPEVLRDLTFSLPTGSFHFLTGASGAGKSSLLRLMYLDLKPTRGLIHLFGHDIARLRRVDLPVMRRSIGVVFQDFRLLPHLTAYQNVALPLLIAGREDQEIRGHVTELLRWVGLGEHADALPSTMSGGEQQRVAIARAVIARPRLLLADEPTGSVDQRIGLRLIYLLAELNRMGTTIVVATHSESIVTRMGHPRLHLADGTLSTYDAEVAV